MGGMKQRGTTVCLALTAGLLAGCSWVGDAFQQWFPMKTENAGSSARAGLRLELLPAQQDSGGAELFLLDAVLKADGSLVAVVSARQAQQLHMLYASLHFDPAQWQPSTVEWTDALAPEERRLALAVSPDSPGGKPGELTLGCVAANWDQQPGFSGDGVLCRVRFRPAGAAGSQTERDQDAAARIPSAAPTSPLAAARLSYDTPSQTLSWYYAFPGDYNQDGEAAITDLTALGQHFNAVSPGGAGAPFPEDSIERQVDGDNNGVINLADLTVLGQNIGRRCDAYGIYRSASQTDFPAARDSADSVAGFATALRSSAGGGPGGRLLFSTMLATALAAGENVWVRPVDGAERGRPSPSYPDGWTLDSEPPPPPAELRAFPGAEGFGAFATGGRGGQVIYVTNLNTSGPGSLQAALDTPGPKYVLFKVSGVINGHVLMTRGDVTVAGQTSPGGVIVRGWICDPQPYVEEDATGLLTNPENFILRHVRSRPDFDNAVMGGTPSDDGLRLHHAVNGIVDHFSIANAADEAVQISWSRDITIQNCMFAETLGDHAYLGGMLLNYGNALDGWPLTRLSIHHNCWNRIMGRMPEISRESPGSANAVMELELSNNLLWDPGIGILVATDTSVAGAQPLFYAMNWVGNRAVGRSSFPEPTAQAPGWTLGMMTPDWLQLSPGGNAAYFSDNRCDNYPGFTDYQQLYCCNDYDQQVLSDPQGLPFPSNTNPGPFARTSRHDFPLIIYTPSSQLVDYMLDNVGARRRDPMDRRLLQWLSNTQIDPARRDLKHAADDTFALDFAPGNPPAPPADSDSDGMPDSWETLNGLNPNVPDHNGTQLSLPATGVEGYTNLEVYLNELADSLTPP